MENSLSGKREKTFNGKREIKFIREVENNFNIKKHNFSKKIENALVGK